MVLYVPRSGWTTTAAGGGILTAGKLIGVSCHYPASGNIIMAGLSFDSVASRLRGWRAYHLSRGWSDIGYQVAVDGAGRIWDLRGIGRIPAASASESNPDANLEWGACLWVVGNSEQPTDAAVEAFQHWRFNRWLVRWPRRDNIIGHGQVPGASTSCPGSRLRELIANRTLYRRPTAPTPQPEQEPTMSSWSELVPDPAVAEHSDGADTRSTRDELLRFARVDAWKAMTAVRALGVKVDAILDQLAELHAARTGDGADVDVTDPS